MLVVSRSAAVGGFSRARVVPLLRYRFDSGSSVELHFQRVDGRTLFHWPLRVEDGVSDVVVEFVPAAGGPPCPLRGRVLGYEAGRFKGTWIELPVGDVAQTMRRAAQTPRSRLRFAVDVMVSLVRAVDGGRTLCGLSDVSVAGARISRLPGPLTPGEEVAISLVERASARPELATGHVVWTHLKQAGVQFTGTSASPALSWLLQQAEQSRLSAREICHPASCRCTIGQAPVAAPASGVLHSDIG